MTTFTNFLKLRAQGFDENPTTWGDVLNQNYSILDFVEGARNAGNRVLAGGLVTAGLGLNVDYEAVETLVNGVVRNTVAGSLAIPGDALTYIYIDATGAAVAASIPPTGNYVPLAVVDTDASSVLRIGDVRIMSEQAAGLIYTPSGNLASERVQGAIDELEAEKAPLSGASPLSHVRAGLTSIQSIAANTTTVVDWSWVYHDQLSDFTAGAGAHFTAPEEGFYSISASVMTDQETWSLGDYAEARIYVDGGVVFYGPRVYPEVGQTSRAAFGAAGTVKIAASGVVDIRVNHSVAGGVDLNNSGYRCFVVIDRLL